MSAPNADDRNDTLGTPDRADTGSQTDAASDATIVRVGPSAGTVNEKPGSFGRYDLLDEIARGGMGVVYRARQRELQRTVALKMILGNGISHETAQRFLQEARAAAALDHPNVVPIYDIGEIGDRPYFTMALVEGPNLRGHVAALGTVPIPTAVALFAQIVAGVAHAHQNGIIHRDLKPANVLIDKDGRPRVTDFGLAKQTSTESQLTVTGQVVGTPQYMAPEQARESKDVGPPADVYSLGAILYFLLTGQPPISGESVTDVLIKVVTEAPVPPSQLRPDTPPEIEALCLRCLAKRPDERYPNAQALLDAVTPIADQYLPPSGLAALARASRASTPSVGSLPVAASLPDLTPTANVVPFPTGATTPSLPSIGAPPAEAPPAPNRKPLLIGLGAVAVALACAIGFLATRGPKNDEVAKGDPPTARPNPAPADPTSAPKADRVKPGPTPAVEPKVAPKKEEKFEWPPPSRADFGLKSVLIAPVGKSDIDGLQLFPNKTELEVHVTADRDCRVAVWVRDATGDLMLFPNDSETDDRLFAGKTRVIPGKGGRAFEASPTIGDVDRLRILATTGDKPVFPEGAKASEYTVYSKPDERERLASTIRGIVLKKAGSGGKEDGQVSEVEIRFRVQK